MYIFCLKTFHSNVGVDLLENEYESFLDCVWAVVSYGFKGISLNQLISKENVLISNRKIAFLMNRQNRYFSCIAFYSVLHVKFKFSKNFLIFHWLKEVDVVITW